MAPLGVRKGYGQQGIAGRRNYCRLTITVDPAHRVRNAASFGIKDEKDKTLSFWAARLAAQGAERSGKRCASLTPS